MFIKKLLFYFILFYFLNKIKFCTDPLKNLFIEELFGDRGKKKNFLPEIFIKINCKVSEIIKIYPFQNKKYPNTCFKKTIARINVGENYRVKAVKLTEFRTVYNSVTNLPVNY